MSRLHLYDENFAAKLGAIADQYGISHRELEIEITENGGSKGNTSRIHICLFCKCKHHFSESCS